MSFVMSETRRTMLKMSMVEDGLMVWLRVLAPKPRDPHRTCVKGKPPHGPPKTRSQRKQLAHHAYKDNEAR